MRHITRNAIRCHSCGGIAESRSRHHMAHCTCGLVAADGGMEYLRRVCDAEFQELSTFVYDTSAFQALVWLGDEPRQCLLIEVDRDSYETLTAEALHRQDGVTGEYLSRVEVQTKNGRLQAVARMDVTLICWAGESSMPDLKFLSTDAMRKGLIGRARAAGFMDGDELDDMPLDELWAHVRRLEAQEK
ncbi:hypothetical protein CU669_16790 [Paramagnetospirillum kuznetsovii]|uniref:DUF7695 domain-containing protein n=1 Tax=Paramagnetospirillum kuznetsovii TaxID=2053833 RepID=A0A364NUQ8_9PROT|nr:hypothetical protein [Paramagnetospirillum kuznetsovii]RAU20740.1 hypothetical protein CU669_16790 [Paramagnetospirillum kuznetsovii]